MVAAHPIVLRGPQVSGATAGPVILERTDEDFVGAVLDELGLERGLEKVLTPEKVARGRDDHGRLKLYQPIQRTFHLVLVEALCDVYGEPRLDPEKIESAGLVVRRCARLAKVDDVNRLEGWRQAGKQFRGWETFQGTAENELDPDPARRPLPLRAGHPEIDRRLALQGGGSEPLIETTVPLFVAPPDVCRQAGRTLLYGVLPVTSHDRTEAPGDITYSTEDVQDAVSPYLYSGVSLSAPAAGSNVDAATAQAHQSDASFQKVQMAVQQAVFQFDAMGETADGQAFFGLLNQHSLGMPGGATKPLGTWLRDALGPLVLNQASAGAVTMPSSWPGFQPALRNQLLAHMKRVMQARVASVRPNVGRFEDGTRLYRVRAFIRVQEEGVCHHGPVWSGYSEPFTIAPWYDGTGVPPVKIQLPDLTKDLLKKLKPNVAFSIPPKLLNMMNNANMKGVLDGKKPSDSGTTIEWICSFNLLIIFMIAFMLMFMFLIVFDLFFSWMLFIKICIPIPKKSSA